MILSASVTLLSLPGLDDVARLAGIVAILLSASSMVSAVIALFKYKADLERTVVYVGGEGLMVMSVSSACTIPTQVNQTTDLSHSGAASLCRFQLCSSLGQLLPLSLASHFTHSAELP